MQIIFPIEFVAETKMVERLSLNLDEIHRKKIILKIQFLSIKNSLKHSSRLKLFIFRTNFVTG